MPVRTHTGKVVLWHRETGQRFERWPVDAREMTATGAYTYDAPAGRPPEQGATPEERGLVETPQPQVIGLAAERRSRLMEQWDKTVSPEAYLERWPDGPNADLAREIIAAGTAHPTGAPANVVQSGEAGPAAPVKIPDGRTPAPEE